LGIFFLVDGPFLPFCSSDSFRDGFSIVGKAFNTFFGRINHLSGILWGNYPTAFGVPTPVACLASALRVELQNEPRWFTEALYDVNPRNENENESEKKYDNKKNSSVVTGIRLVRVRTKQSGSNKPLASDDQRSLHLNQFHGVVEGDR
jgi:hypothetical protein